MLLCSLMFRYPPPSPNAYTARMAGGTVDELNRNAILREKKTVICVCTAVQVFTNTGENMKSERVGSVTNCGHCLTCPSGPKKWWFSSAFR
jgi:hypothetical protein